MAAPRALNRSLTFTISPERGGGAEAADAEKLPLRFPCFSAQIARSSYNQKKSCIKGVLSI